ncbi:MAG: error-prone DNA polymerase [Caulobacterales bacterium]|nr:error-prone DNA polymerase [Caulobacterales bacterium]
MSAYAEMVAASNFSFLRGASRPRDLVLTAVALGLSGLGIADRNTVAGTARAWSTLKTLREDGLSPPDRVRWGGGPGEIACAPNPLDDTQVRDEIQRRAQAFHLALGTRLAFTDGTPDILAYPQTRTGWGRLCRLLTRGNLRGRKGECLLQLSDLEADTEGLLLIVMPPRRLEGLDETLIRVVRAAPDATWLGATALFGGDDRRRLAQLVRLAERAGTPPIATNDVLYHAPSERDLQDVLTCVREGVTLHQAGRRLQANAERHIKTPEEMTRLFRAVPDALTQGDEMLARMTFDLGDLKYEYPEEPIPPGWSAQAWLSDLTWRRADVRYPDGVPDKVRAVLDKELTYIGQRDLAPYFLTIHDIVREAENRGILCQGRGSAANSAVCFVLGITSVDPAHNDVLFERFLSADRSEPPDIDVDFEHERREEIIQHIYQRYGRDRAGIAATVIHYRPRSAIRDVGKVLGLTEDVTARLAGSQWGSWGSDIPDRDILQAGLDPANPMVRRAVDMARRVLGFPRHLSQHVGGFVLTRGRLDELVPIGNAAMADRTFIEWDRDDIDALGLMKVDILALGMLTCIRKAFDLMRTHERNGDHDLASVPGEDPAVYEMLCRGDSLGVFQVESRAQINMLPRLRPRTFYDLVIQVAIVRPGPIQGDMVHPYLRRRDGVERVDYQSPAPEHGPPDELEQVLKKTLGVPLFQEQAMKVAMVAAEFSSKEANGLRKAMGTFRGDGTLHTYEDRFVGRMVARGYDPAFAQRCFEQIKGFGSYGFPESHAASFARLVYISSYIKHYHPAVFAAALLNSQPMGFYAPAQIVRDAQEHGVEARAIDVNHSDWDNTLEGAPGGLALRLGLRQIDGFRQAWAVALQAGRDRPYRSLEDLMRRGGLTVPTLKKLADADAFRSLGMDRREGLWAVRRLPDDDPLPLFAVARARELGEEADANLPTMPLGEHVAADYQMTRLSLKAHPMTILRPVFQAEGVLSCAEATALNQGHRVRVAGVVLVRQRPGNGKAIFVTIEDETGVANVVMWADQFERFRRQVMAARLMQIDGMIERSKEGVVHVMTREILDRTPELKRLSEDHVPAIQMSEADEFAHGPTGSARHPRNVRILPGSRDFH